MHFRDNSFDASLGPGWVPKYGHPFYFTDSETLSLAVGLGVFDIDDINPADVEAWFLASRLDTEQAGSSTPCLLPVPGTSDAYSPPPAGRSLSSALALPWGGECHVHYRFSQDSITHPRG